LNFTAYKALKFMTARVMVHGVWNTELLKYPQHKHWALEQDTGEE
jgi:hypothetical protein